MGSLRLKNYIGYMYLTGSGTEQDEHLAFQWYQKAAIQGHAPSQYSVGHMYYNGISIATDIDQAKEWFQKASDQGLENATQALKDIQ